VKIDICSHVMPKKFKEALLKKTKNKQINSLDFVEQNRVLYDMELRLRLLNRYSELTEVLVPMPAPLESFVSLEDACDLARLNNDETAELVEKYPDKFLAAAAILPQNDIDAAQKELERVVTKLGMRGIILYSNVNDESLDIPKFRPLFAQMAEYDLPIFVHPSYLPINCPPFPQNIPLAYQNHFNHMVTEAIQRPSDTSITMMRLAMSGIFRDYPGIRLIVHHCGGFIPFCQDRITLRDDDMRKFYSDTALVYSNGPLLCSYKYFGPDHLLFGTDTPLGRSHGYSIGESIRGIEQLDIPNNEKEKIFERNALSVLRLTI